MSEIEDNDIVDPEVDIEDTDMELSEPVHPAVTAEEAAAAEAAAESELAAPLPPEPEPDDEETSQNEPQPDAPDLSIERGPRGKLFSTNWLADVAGADECPYVQVIFKNTRTGFYTNPSHIPLKIGDIVAVEASPGHDIGRVQMVGPLVMTQMKKGGVKDITALKKVFRIARPADIEKFDEARAREHDTMIRSRRIAEELNLNMKIGDVEYQGDGGKAIFYYIADERVDFRKLIRILADTFKVRIEMKQIGARQEAGRIGGIGPCGRPLCCSSWMTHFVSVGTGSARIQDLSMNPQKLAGQCAKLKCCLNFEVSAYAEAQKKMPHRDVTLETKDATYYYFKPDILAGLVTYSTDKHMPANLVTITAARAFEIIALNKQGVKVDSLEGENSLKPAVKKEFVEIVGQDSLTRFDKAKRKKKKGGNGNGNGNGDKKQPPKQQNGEQQPKPKDNGDQPKQSKQQNGEQPKQKQRPPRLPKGGDGQQQSQVNGERRREGEKKPQRQRPPKGQRKPDKNKNAE